MWRRRIFFGCWLVCAACSEQSRAADDANAPDSGEADAATSGDIKPYVVGTRRLELKSGSRTLPLQLWYPAIESARPDTEAGRSLSEFEPAGAQRTQLEMLLAKAPDACVSKTMHAADAPLPLTRTESFPLVLLSHCHGGARFGLFTIAEVLVRQGFVVAALDHVDDTIYEQLAGTIVLPLGDEVERRVTDLTRLLDVVLDPNATLLPDGLRGKLDAQRVGIVGHSIGSITTGQFTWREQRVKASVFIAAPPTVPILTPTVLAEFKVPGLFVHATEDNSIPIELNDMVLSNFEDFPQPAWLASLTDAGHFAFSDIAGIIPELSPGCGDASRQTDPSAAFSYLDPKLVRELTSSFVAAFFERTLLQGPGDALNTTPNPKVMLKHHD